MCTLVRALRQEALDLVEQRVLVADERQVIVARQLDERRAWDQARDVAPFLHEQRPVAGAVEHQRRHANRRENVRDVDFGVHARQRDGRRRARAHAQERGPPFAKRRIVAPCSAPAPRHRPVRPSARRSP